MAAVRGLGAQLGPYIEALWQLAGPVHERRVAPDPDPQSFRRTAERGIGPLLGHLHAQRPDLVLFLDGYEHADVASAALLEGLKGTQG